MKQIIKNKMLFISLLAISSACISPALALLSNSEVQSSTNKITIRPKPEIASIENTAEFNQTTNAIVETTEVVSEETANTDEITVLEAVIENAEIVSNDTTETTINENPTTEEKEETTEADSSVDEIANKTTENLETGQSEELITNEVVEEELNSTDDNLSVIE